MAIKYKNKNKKKSDDDEVKKKKLKLKKKAKEEDEPPFDVDEEEDKPSKKKSKKEVEDEEEEDQDEDADDSDDDADEDSEDSDDDEDSDEDSDDEDEDEAPKKSKKSKKDDDDSDEDDDDDSEEDEDSDDDDDSDDDEDEDEEDDDDLKGSSKAKASSKDKKKKPSGFLKRGKARKAMIESEDQKAEARAEAAGKPRRFFIHEDRIDDDIRITFLDGDLDDDGIIDNPTYYEHNIKINGRWTQFVSCCDNEPDPLQAAGQEPYPAQAFTVIDHTGYVDKDGKEWTNIKRLFIAKRKTQKQLQKLASKKKGLKGLTVDICRTGPKEPNVGNNFTAVKKRSIKDLKALLIKNGVKKKDVDALVTPANYEEDLLYYSAKDLRKMGLVDTAKTISSKKANEDAKDVDDEL